MRRSSRQCEYSIDHSCYFGLKICFEQRICATFHPPDRDLCGGTGSSFPLPCALCAVYSPAGIIVCMSS